VRVDYVTPATSVGPSPPVAFRPERGRFDRFELALLIVFGAISMWVVALDLFHVVGHDRVWTGTDGFYIVDQMQYLAWVQSASQHLLIANLFVLRSTPADYFQPAIAISGMISALGVAPWLALLLWKPVAVFGMFFAIRAFAHRLVSGRNERRSVLALGLFFGSFSLIYGSFGIVGDMFPDFLSWGYPFALMAVAAILFALLRYDRARATGRLAWGPGLLGALASTLHPWQGELLILVLVLAEGVRWRELVRSRRLVLPLVTIGLTAAPLVYYVLLGHLDLSWNLARNASKHAFPVSAIAIGIAPLAIVAALGYRGRPHGFLDLATRVWPLAALVIYVLSATGLSATPLHAFDGITVPLAVLAVKGVGGLGRRRPRGATPRRPVSWRWSAAAGAPGAGRRLGLAAAGAPGAGRGLGLAAAGAPGAGRGLGLAAAGAPGAGRRLGLAGRLSWRGRPVSTRRAIGTLAVAVATIPANVYVLRITQQYTAPATANSNFITPSESAALNYLRTAPAKGGVLTQFYLGEVVPARTGRQTFVGDCLWAEPNCMPKSTAADKLFTGSLSPQASQTFVRQTGARFVLASCVPPQADLTPKLGKLLTSVRHFGCATVYQLYPPSPPTGPLAELPPHAAVRAPRRQ
jgi:hypothetical protein